MKVGYARIFKNDPDVSIQLEALKHAGCKQIFTEKADGIQKDHPGLERTLYYMREGDSLVVWRLERLGRSLTDLLDTFSQLRERGLGFQSLQESIDTTTGDGPMIFQIFATLAEFERNINKERTQAGLRVARARGRKGGRSKKLDAEKTQLLYRLYDEQKHPIGEICRMLGISKPTLYAYLKRRREK
jgi:DNA invertase Pin-like site-specific DNA recombinase